MEPFNKWLECLPFPIVVTNDAGLIQGFNSPFVDLTDNAVVGIALPTLFDQWVEHTSSLFTAQRNQNSYLILAKAITQEGACYIFHLAVPHSYIQALQQKITSLEQELDAVMEITNDVIYITDKDGVTLKANSAIERFTGFPKHRYISHNVRDLLEQGLLKTSITLKVLEQKQTVNYIYTSSYFSNQQRFATGMPLFNDKGEIEKVITNVRDLTELTRFYNDLKEALLLNQQYRNELEKLKTNEKTYDPEIVVASKQMMEIYDMAERIADVEATVLILGETGTGKDVLARHIYRTSKRSEKGEFVKINCGAIPHDLLESELFGYEGGAFTGANRTGKQGLFELAHKGVLFLDEVGEMPLALQVKLLRVLQEKQIQRIGATKPKHVDVRLVAATNRDLKKMVQQGTFREDLYYRLNVIPIQIPPLRERKDDILPIVNKVLTKLNTLYRTSKEFDKHVEAVFYHHTWPGNVRELTNLIERLILTVPFKRITYEDLPMEYRMEEENTAATIATPTKEMTLKEALENAEKDILAIAVQKFASTYKIAEELGTSQTTIVRKLKKYKL